VTVEGIVLDIARTGLLGALLGLFIYLWLAERKANNELHVKRLEDFRENNRSYKELADKLTSMIAANQLSIDAAKVAIAEMREDLEEARRRRR
jgi:hypothetical protein